jgi:acetyl-CoA acyltransferase
VGEAVVVDVIRTASGRGKPGGALSGAHPATLLAELLSALVERNGLDGSTIDDVIAGCVAQVGDQSLNVARTAVLAAGLPESVPGTTIDRQCGSSQQAVHFAVQGVLAGSYDIVVACGVESMSRVPMGSANAGGDSQAPLAERYPDGLVGQGVAAELVARRWNLSRRRLDEYAARSHELASAASANGLFDREILPVHVTGADGTTAMHHVDETVRGGTTVERLGGLAPAFRTEELAQRFPEITWDITAGNSSPLSDGASAVLIMSADRARALGLTPRARVHTMTVVGSDPMLMLTGVIPATQQALRRSGLTLDQIDAFEVNEAFASVPLAFASELGVDEKRLNPTGGAIALGHPLGASGTRILATLVNQLESTLGRYGLQAMCEFGGMANATIIERLD